MLEKRGGWGRRRQLPQHVLPCAQPRLASENNASKCCMQIGRHGKGWERGLHSNIILRLTTVSCHPATLTQHMLQHESRLADMFDCECMLCMHHGKWPAVHSLRLQGCAGIRRYTLAGTRYPGKACQCMCCILNCAYLQMSNRGAWAGTRGRARVRTVKGSQVQPKMRSESGICLKFARGTR